MREEGSTGVTGDFEGNGTLQGTYINKEVIDRGEMFILSRYFSPKKQMK